MLRSLALSVIAPALLSGCTALNALVDVSEPQDAYQVQASAEGPVAAGPPRELQLIVEVPTASAAVDTESILIRPQPNQVQYLGDARWIETAPLMLQSALVDGLDRTGAYRFVGRRPLGSSGDYALVVNLAEFDAVVVPGGEGAEIRLRLSARLIREDDLRITATRTFSRSVMVPDTETGSVISGFDRAATATLDEMVLWVLRSTGVGIARAGDG